jgi:hypothetical protein
MKMSGFGDQPLFIERKRAAEIVRRVMHFCSS